MKKIISILVAIALVGFLIYTITYHKKVIPVEGPGKVSATGAYEKYFGPAPTVDKGTAYAFVIYFPSSKEPGKVVPFQFFTFDEQGIKKWPSSAFWAAWMSAVTRENSFRFPAGAV